MTVNEKNEKKAWLKRYQQINREVARLQEELTRWRSMAVSCGRPGGMGGTVNAVSDQIQIAIERISAMEFEISGKLKELLTARKEIAKAIDALEDVRLRSLLKYRYIDGRSWAQIAEQMEVGERWVMRMHGEALKNLVIGQ